MQFLIEIVKSEEDSFSNKKIIQDTSNVVKQYLENKVSAGRLHVLEWPS